MIRFLAGVAAALLLTTAGVLLWNGRAADRHLPGAPPSAGPSHAYGKEAGDEPPAASAESREQRRFARYDKDEDGKVSRDEYFANRHKAFAKLDANHDGRLTFDEWAAKAIGKFASADHDRSTTLDRVEFATTAVKRRANQWPRHARQRRRARTIRASVSLRPPRRRGRRAHAPSSAPCARPCARPPAAEEIGRS